MSCSRSLRGRQRPAASGRCSQPVLRPLLNGWHAPTPQWHQTVQLAQCAAIEQDVEPHLDHPVTSFHIDPQDTDLQEEASLSPRKLINRQLKQTASLLQLRMLLEAEHAAFDSVNTSFALSLVAKMSRSVIEQFKRAGLLSPEARARHYSEHVAPCLAVLQPLVYEHIDAFDAWDTALCLWAFASLDYYDRQLFELLCSRALQLRDELKPIDCANIMVAFGRWGHYHPELLRSLPQVLLDHMYDAKPSEVMQVLWGFAKLRVAQAPGRPFLEAICEYIASSMHAYGSTELACVLWALARLRFYPGRLFLQHAEALMLRRLRAACASSRDALASSPPATTHSKLSNPYDTSDVTGHQRNGAVTSHVQQGASNSTEQQHMGQRRPARRQASWLAPRPAPDPRMLTSQDASLCLWAFGQLRYKAALLLDELPLCLGAWLPQFSTSSLCALLTGYTHARHYHHGVMEALASFLTPRLHTLSTGELTILLWSYGMFHHRPAAEPRFLSMLSNQLHAHLLAPSGPGPRPQTLALIAKSCANLQFRPEPLLQQVVQGSLLRLGEFTPDEMAHLLYGMSYLASRAPACDLPRAARPAAHAVGAGEAGDVGVGVLGGSGEQTGASDGACRRIVQQEEMQLFYGVVRQCMRLLDEPNHPYGSRDFLHHKVLNSIVHSCVRIGYTPWSLVDFAESKGMRLVQLSVAESAAPGEDTAADVAACDAEPPPRALVSTPGRAYSGQHTRPPADVDVPLRSRADQHLATLPTPSEMRHSRSVSRRPALFSAAGPSQDTTTQHSEPQHHQHHHDAPYAGPSALQPELHTQQESEYADHGYQNGVQGNGVSTAGLGLLHSAHADVHSVPGQGQGQGAAVSSTNGVVPDDGRLRLLDRPTRLVSTQGMEDELPGAQHVLGRARSP